MGLPPPPPLLADILRTVTRRYRLPKRPAPQQPDPQQPETKRPDPLPGPRDVSATSPDPASTLAITIDKARVALTRGQEPGPALRTAFLQAFADLIREAAHPIHGDPSFQAMLLRYQTPQVREYASLSAQSDQDRRVIHAIVNTVAHPAKLARRPASEQREALAGLHAAKESADWSGLTAAAQRIVDQQDQIEAPQHAATRLLASAELSRQQRLAHLATDAAVKQYQTLLDRHTPRGGQDTALARASTAQQRGASMEAKAAQVLHRLAQQLNEAEIRPPATGSDQDGRSSTYRVVTSMRVPASIPGITDRAKSEWDAVLLSQVQHADPDAAWDVRLLVEVKASVDAATTDFPRLLRGLDLLASAKPGTTYRFATQQGDIRISGASLAALTTRETELGNEVLYCCDGPPDNSPRLLNAASRMQLLSSDASLAFADKIARHLPVDAQELDPVWQALLHAARWQGVLGQYPTLYGVRALMVHIDDLSAAIYADGG